MCGIAGLAGITERVCAETAVQTMVLSLARRGPDSEGIESWSEAVLGHRRLAIFDLSDAGRQPMVSEDRSVGVVFNGSIYNYRELRKQLMTCGYAFRSNSDTEVLLHGYREWGVDRLVCQLRGMFAFGIWDNLRRSLYLVRDRLGVKPLVFALGDKEIAFASTVRALRVGGFVGEFDESAVREFLTLGFISDDCSIYRGVRKVPAGYIIEWSDGILKERQYWEPPTIAVSRTPSSQALIHVELFL